MHYTLYAFMTGIGFQAALTVCLGGTALKLFLFFKRAAQKDRAFFAFYSWKYAGRSILFHLIPYVSRTTRTHPVMTVATTAFHMAILTLPFFYSAHGVLLSDSSFFRLPRYPEAVSDVLAVIALCALLFFLGRRLFLRAVRYITTPADHMLLASLIALVLSGLWARFQWPGFLWASLIHMTAGNLIIAAIPFTRLSHIFYMLITRGYAGSEFGGVRMAKDW
ncbi:nitrate reductase [Desulfoluna butyratoxydans]|uniref:Narg-like domain n=1 Tax=Desulfoluna butyratoxydans TaxID=231438 RepID=A0A4U8YM67_9BACT|nr:nitrate reductase [Desulfoluna butyratoxydans]VFQ45116.1 narg-like domain [Desulfoluna butyratoxydans]